MTLRNLIPALLGLLAAAIGIPEDQRDIAVWAGSAVAFAPIVGGLVTHLRIHVFRSLDGIAVPLFAVAVGAVLGSVLGWSTNLIGGGLVEWATFGAFAGILAAFGVDLGRTIVKAAKA